MKLRTLLVAIAAAGLFATVASAQTATPVTDDATPRHGEKENKQRINLVARKPLRHDIDWLDTHDRASWRTFTTWQGVRDERPLIARKVMGFHEPRPHMPRFQRMLRTSRGPIRGPAPAAN